MVGARYSCIHGRTGPICPTLSRDTWVFTLFYGRPAFQPDLHLPAVSFVVHDYLEDKDEGNVQPAHMRRILNPSESIRSAQGAHRYVEGVAVWDLIVDDGL